MSNFKFTVIVIAVMLFSGMSYALGTDAFSTYRQGLTGPARSGFAVTPDDSNSLTNTPRALFVGGGGNIKMTLVSGDVITLTGVVGGSVIAVRADIIWSTGTTATSIDRKIVV